MVSSVDIRHWLTEDGYVHPAARRQALRAARLIEYRGPLEACQMRETLVECSRRPGRRPCEGLLWVVKTADGCIDAFCQVCKQERVTISGWQDTDWADGPMEPVGTEQLPWDYQRCQH